MKSTLNEVFKLIDNLPEEEKIIVFKYLKNTIDLKMNNLLSKIRTRYEKYPISLDEITNEVEMVREDKYEYNKKDSN